MGKCDVMWVTEWLIEWSASQERRSVACHTSEFPRREPEITTIVGSLPIIQTMIWLPPARKLRGSTATRATSVNRLSIQHVGWSDWEKVGDDERESQRYGIGLSIINNPTSVSIVRFLPIPESGGGHEGENDRLSVPKSPVDWPLSRVIHRPSVTLAELLRWELDARSWRIW